MMAMRRLPVSRSTLRQHQVVKVVLLATIGQRSNQDKFSQIKGNSQLENLKSLEGVTEILPRPNFLQWDTGYGNMQAI